MYIYIYIYRDIDREREMYREREIIHTHTHTHNVHTSTYNIHLRCLKSDMVCPNCVRLEFPGWANIHFNNLRFIKSLGMKKTHEMGIGASFMFSHLLKRRLLK